MKESSLIFLVSQPRSGSTYLQSLIANHSEVNTTSEAWIMLHYINQLNPKLVQTSVNNHLTQEAFQLYLEKFPGLNYRSALKSHLLSLYEPLNRNCTYILDKTPRYWEILPELIDLFPDARYIILRRNPFHVARSMVKTWKLNSLNALNKFRRDLLYAPDLLAGFSKEHESNKNVYHLSYEALVQQPEREIKAIMEWLGLEFLPEMVNSEVNEKVKGKFGDPGQNPEFHDKDEDAGRLLDETRFREFLQGYAAFLGPDYLKAFNDLQTGTQPEETNTFQNFLSLKDPFENMSLTGDGRENLLRENKALKKELVQIKNSGSYKLVKRLKSLFS